MSLLVGCLQSAGLFSCLVLWEKFIRFLTCTPICWTLYVFAYLAKYALSIVNLGIPPSLLLKGAFAKAPSWIYIPWSGLSQGYVTRKSEKFCQGYQKVKWSALSGWNLLREENGTLICNLQKKNFFFSFSLIVVWTQKFYILFYLQYKHYNQKKI